MKVWQYNRLGLEHLKLAEQDLPILQDHEVLVRMHAASLNYRDLLFADGAYNAEPRFPAIPLSDGAGEVVATGKDVTRWKTGDRVCPIFMQGWIDGERDSEKAKTDLGGGRVDGVLREYAAFSEEGLTAIPEHLSWEEAATLPCAAVTAWHALVENGRIRAGDTILTLGTGGVSVFAIQFARLHGARVISTSSSDEKLARARELGADETINYRKTPEWDREVLRLTGGKGVDHVVETGGAGTLPQSLNATRMGGLVSLIGVLTGGQIDPVKILMKGIRLQGTFVGSRKMFEDMNRAISLAKLRPVIDHCGTFAKAPAVTGSLREGRHFGKIVINAFG